jgi:DNA-binding response OmpR family regulator
VNVLIVEDDAQLAELLERVFREEGHAPTTCRTARSASEAANGGSFDLVILDWMLPDGDGLGLCAKLRQTQPTVAILMLTARGEVRDRVEGLRVGADDYLTKPFDVEELLARAGALHRRATQAWVTRIGALEIDRRTQTARIDGARVELTGREYALLARLAAAPDQCVTRAELLRDVWNTSFDQGSGLIDVHVSRLRDKLGAFEGMIETVRGRGFRLTSRE